MATQTRPAPAPSAPPVFEPFVPPSQSPAEPTVRAVILGAILGIVFAASSVYLALKIGLTVSASIPIAVLSVAFFRTLFGLSPAPVQEFMEPHGRMRSRSLRPRRSPRTSGSATARRPRRPR